MISIFDTPALVNWARSQKLPAATVEKVARRLIRDGQAWDPSVGDLAADIQNKFESTIRWRFLTPEVVQHSRHDGASKVLFRTDRGFPLETVILRIASGRTSLCVSSQSGCAVGCRFCATGQMSVTKNLTADEILDQALQANQMLAEENRRVRNVVFMGMGEPLHNTEAVCQALAVLRDPRRFNLADRRLVVSTIGVEAGMLTLAKTFPNVRLALSLHSARPSVRRQLIPWPGADDLEGLHQTLTTVQSQTSAPTFIEYLMLAGVTDTDADLAALLGFLGDLRAHVNLIPFNPSLRPTNGVSFRNASADRYDVFQTALRSAGFPCTKRYSLGQDIAAACGQLATLPNVQANAATSIM